MSTGHVSTQHFSPPAKYRTVNTTTWGTGGNSVTITDAYIHANSAFFPWVTGTQPAAGNWSWTCSNGSVIITSDSVETSTLPISYIVF